MIVYTGHPVFDWVYIVDVNAPDKGRLRGCHVNTHESLHFSCWKLPDNQQPLGTTYTPEEYATDVLSLTPLTVDAVVDEDGNLRSNA